MNQDVALGITTGQSRSLKCPPDDSNRSRNDADLQLLLEEMARAHGHANYSEMERYLANEGAQLEKAERREILARLSRVKNDADEVLDRPALPAVDATGLVAIADIVKSVTRLIRVLLLGYTEDEIEELVGRAKAERAANMESAGARRELELDHELILDRLSDAADQRRSRTGP